VLSLLIVTLGTVLIYLPHLAFLEMTPLPLPVLTTILFITVLYAITSELLKRKFLTL
jgi:hypothetical protein